MLETAIRVQQLMDAINDTFPSHREPDKARAFSFLFNDEMRPIRVQLDKLAEGFDPAHPQFCE